jgi:hypothetical protein
MHFHPVSRAMLGCGMALLLTAYLGNAQQHDTKPAGGATLPEGLRHVPPDAMGFVHLRAGDFLNSALGKALLQELGQDREASKGLKQVEQTLGIEATDLESVTLLFLTPPRGPQMYPWNGGMPRYGPKGPKDRFREFDMKKAIIDQIKIEQEKERLQRLLDELRKKLEDQKADEKAAQLLLQGNRPLPPRVIQEIWGIEDHDVDMLDMADYFAFSGPLMIVTSKKPIDRKKILRAQLFQTKPKDIYGPPAQHPSVMFLTDRTVMMGAAWELGRYSEMVARNPGPKTKPLQSALALGAKSHLVTAGGHVPADYRRLLFSPSPFDFDLRALAPLSPLLQTETALALDLGQSIDLKLQFQAPTEESAATALHAVKSLRVFGELAIEKSREAGESGGAKLALEKALIKALADATIDQQGTLVRAELKLELAPSFYKSYIKDIVAAFRQRGDRAQSVNNLKQIGLALHNYHDANKRFPPAGIGDRDGKPLLSWRVAILPYIEQGEVFQQFNLNLPWDHPTNKKLIARMPAIFAMPGAESKEGMTHYRVLVGGGAMFDARMGVKITQITDGTSNTFMVVEAKDPTIWTRPDDLPYDPMGPLPKFGVSPDGFNALLADGSVHFVRSTTPENVLRAYITRAGGEVAPPLD